MAEKRTVRETVLIAEDDREVRECIEMMLRCQGYDVVTACDGEEAIACLEAGPPVSAVVLDIMMPKKDGLETLRELRQWDRQVPVVMLSGLSTPVNVVQAIKAGASDFLAKPVTHEDLGRAVKQALAARTAPPLGAHDSSESTRDMFFGKSPSMQALKSSLGTIAACDVPVLIEAETGTGKEVLARQLHLMSSRAGKPFVKLNCAAVPSELMESELFGYEKGAFTGAFQRKPGVFELADGGTLLLDEIGDMDVRLQAKLLQVLQDQEFRRLGGRETIRVQVRVLAATHCNLTEAVAKGKFREDLYYRLNVFTLTMPALRERREDIVSMAEFLIQKHSSPQTPPVAITERLASAMANYSWPGNVRQLENVIRKFLVLRDANLIAHEIEELTEARGRMHDAPEPVATFRLTARPESQPRSLIEQVSRAKNDAEAAVILSALNAVRWNRKQAAQRLNIDYKALLYKMKKLSIEERAERETLSA